MTIAGRTLTREETFRLVLIGGVLFLIPAIILLFRGQMFLPAAALGVLAFAILSYYWPLPMVAGVMFFSTSALKFVRSTEWPHLIPGLPLDPPDIAALGLFGMGVAKLIARRERPLFLGPLLLFGGAVALSTLLGPVLGTQSLYDGLNGLRQITGYLFYFGLVGLIDTPRKLRGLIGLVFAFVLLSVAIQLLETIRGEQFTAVTSPFNEYYANKVTVSAGGIKVPYLWNRAGGYLLVGLFLALGQGLWMGGLASWALVALALVGYVVQLIRQWYVFLAAGGLVSVLLLRKGRLQIILGVTLAALLLATFAGLFMARDSSSHSLLQVWLGRVGTLFRFQEEENFVIRIRSWQEQLRLFWRSPLVGYGPGSSDRLGASAEFVFYDADTGMSNTLLQYGFLGWVAILVFIAAFFRQAYVLFRALPVSRERGYVAGLLALWVVMAIGYATFQDFFTYIELVFAVGLVAALLDRIKAFTKTTEDTAQVQHEHS